MEGTELQNSLTLNPELWHIAIFIIISAIAFLFLARYIIYYLEEKGGVDKVRSIVNNSKFCQNIIWFFKPFIEPIEKSEIESNNQDVIHENDITVKQTNPDLEYTYHKSSERGIFKYKNEEPFFINRRRALIFEYFYTNQDKQNIVYTLYNDWVDSIGREDKKVNSGDFNKDIIGINTNIRNHSYAIQEAITLTNGNKLNSNETNIYKFEIIPK